MGHGAYVGTGTSEDIEAKSIVAFGSNVQVGKDEEGTCLIRPRRVFQVEDGRQDCAGEHIRSVERRIPALGAGRVVRGSIDEGRDSKE